MKPFWRVYLSIQAALYHFEKTVSALLMLTIAVVVLGGTFSRYVLAEPWYGTDRLATYLFMVLSFWGIQMASSYYEHIQIEVVATWIKGRGRALLSAGAYFVSGVFLGLLAWWGYKYARLSAQEEEVDLVLHLPLWWVYGFFVLAMGLAALRYFIGVGLWLRVWQGHLEPQAFQRKILL